MAMFAVRMPIVFLTGAILLLAADPPWKTKAPANWSEDDAFLVLSNSPWAKTTVAGITRLQSEDERRAGGEMGQAKGVGFDGIQNGQKPMPNMSSIVGGPNANPKRTGNQTFAKLRVVWENVLPVHVAELKSHEVEPPTVSEDGYMVVVYGVPPSFVKGDPLSLGEPLKKLALLKREGKPDVKPSSVEVFQRDAGLVIAYVFPVSAEITKNDERVDFQAQIGRIVVSQFFSPPEMLVQGKSAI